MTARLAYRSHQVTAQASAAANNMALLAHTLTDLATSSPSLPPEAEEVSKATSAILSLTACVAVAAARMEAWQTQIHRHLWLQQFSLPTTRKELIEAPVQSDGLFGQHFRHLVDNLHSSEEEAGSIHRHMGWSQPRTDQPGRPAPAHRDQWQRGGGDQILTGWRRCVF